MGNHPQGDLILVFAGALAPQPLNLHHCHLKNIVVSHLRDSNLSFKSSYLRSCHHTVATWKGIVLEDIFSSVTNESFLSLKKAHVRSLHLGAVLDCVRAVFSERFHA